MERDGSLQQRAPNAGDDESSGPLLDAETQMRLGRVLEDYCQEIIREPVPDIFLSLLARLEAKERQE